jgi:hypothetical protein
MRYNWTEAARFSQNAGRQASKLAAMTAIAAPAMTNCLYWPIKPR